MLKKISLAILTILLLTGCSMFPKKDDSKEKSASEYESFYKAINDHDTFSFQSNYYKLTGEIVSLPNGKYNYYIFLDNPQIAMYNIKLLAVEKGSNYLDSKNMAASLGIFGKEKYSLIPYQVFSEGGYFKGLMISGETDKNEIEIDMLVSWHGSERDKSYKEFLNFKLGIEGIIEQHDDFNTERK